MIKLKLLFTIILCYTITFMLNKLVNKYEELKQVKKLQEELLKQQLNTDDDFWSDLEYEDISTERDK